MVFNDFLKQYRLRELRCGEKDNLIAKRVLDEYTQKCGKLLIVTGNYIDDLLFNYFLLKNTEKGVVLETIMNKYNFNYSMSIHNAIYYLLGNHQDLVEINTNPLSWPGIGDIKLVGDTYTLETVLGTIHVNKASYIFKDTQLSYIFDKSLMGKCHERSYEFINENRDDYQVVLSYMPNFFYGGHYHTYLKSNSATLDIAANSYYEGDNSHLVLNGNIIKELNYYEIRRVYKNLYNRMPELRKRNSNKLLTLALYYDYRNNG